MKDIVYSKDNCILLNTSLSEEMFGKTKFSHLLDEEGLLVSKDENGNFCVFSTWKMDTCQTIEGEVHFSKEGFSGTTLDTIILEDKEPLRQALYDVISAITFAQKQNISIPCNSPLGIIYTPEQIIFLPEKTFDRSAANLGLENYQKIQNVWRDAAESGKKAESFLQGTLAYYALTKKLPYTADEKALQSVNIADKKFLPLEYCINGINRNVSFAINDALKKTLKDSKYFPLELFKEELFFEGRRKNAVSDEQFQKAVENFKSRQNIALGTKRRIRKSWVTAMVVAAAVLVISIFVIGIRMESGRKPSVKGLNSSAVTETFYRGIHEKIPEYMKITGEKCPQAQYYIKTVPEIFITAQMAGAYNFQSGISTPENWLFFEPDTTKSYSHQIYGISNFTIDGIPSALDKDIPSISEDKYRITREDGKRIKNLDQKKHTVRYYLIHTVANRLQVDDYQTTVTLTYEDELWQITDLDQKWTTEFFDWAEFSRNYKKILDENNGDVIKSSKILKEQYPFVPTEESLLKEQKYLDSLGY